MTVLASALAVVIAALLTSLGAIAAMVVQTRAQPSRAERWAQAADDRINELQTRIDQLTEDVLELVDKLRDCKQECQRLDEAVYQATVGRAIANRKLAEAEQRIADYERRHSDE